MPPIPHSILRAGTAYLPPLLALAAALIGALLCRTKTRQQWVPAAGALACLVGWAALIPLPTLWHLTWTPRNGPELLLIPAAAACLASMGKILLRSRVVPLGLALLIGWWLGNSPAGQPEFWRVCIGAALLSWLLATLLAGQPARGLAAALTLAGGLTLAGSPHPWVMAALAAGGVFLGLLAGPAAVPPAPVLAATVLGADLAAGRALRGAVNLADLTCLAACAAPVAAAWLTTRLGKTAGRAGPALAALLAAALATASAWIANRALHGR